jgi:hypothetical protein
MDYNQYAPHAFTVCQTELLNADLAGAGNLFVHSCNGCMPAIAFFDMLDEYRICPLGGIHPGGQKAVLNGQAAFNEDTYLIDICEVDYTGQITVLSPAAAALPGEYQLLWPSQSLPSGPYSLQAVFNSDIYAATIIKP